jgi:quinol monooxygenase YgiN
MDPPGRRGPVSATVTLQFQVKPDKIEDAIEFLRKVLPETRSYEGFESIVLHQSMDDPTVFLFYEQWASRANYEAYLAWRTETGVLAQLVEMLVGEPSFGFYDAIDA